MLIVAGVIVTKSSSSVIFSQVEVSHIYAAQSTTSVIFLPTLVSHICHKDSDSGYNLAINEQTIGLNVDTSNTVMSHTTVVYTQLFYSLFDFVRDNLGALAPEK